MTAVEHVRVDPHGCTYRIVRRYSSRHHTGYGYRWDETVTVDLGREDIVEAYYTARVYRGVFPAIDLQVISDRTPTIRASPTRRASTPAVCAAWRRR